MSDLYKNNSLGLAGLFINFVKVTILLVFIYMVVLELHLAVERIGISRAVLVNVTDTLIYAKDGDFHVSFLAAPLFESYDRISVHITPCNQSAEGYELAAIECPLDKCSDSVDKKAKGGLYAANFKVLQPGTYDFKYRFDFLNNQEVSIGQSKENALRVIYEETNEPLKHEMYIVQDQWNFLPMDLRDKGAIIQGMSIPNLRLGDKLEWKQTGLRSLTSREFDGRYSLADNHIIDFKLKVLGILNRPPRPVRGGEVIGFVYRAGALDFPNHSAEQQDWCFLLNDHIIDPDGIEPGFRHTKVKDVQIPTPNYRRYKISPKVTDYRIIRLGEPVGEKYYCPYTVVEEDGLFKLVRSVSGGTPILSDGISIADAQNSSTYESFKIHVSDMDPGDHSDKIEIRVRYLGR